MVALIVAAGLGVGYAVNVVPAMLKPVYVEGDYSAYFPNDQQLALGHACTAIAICRDCGTAR